jgi:hypothetical protein
VGGKVKERAERIVNGLSRERDDFGRKGWRRTDGRGAWRVRVTASKLSLKLVASLLAEHGVGREEVVVAWRSNLVTHGVFWRCTEMRRVVRAERHWVPAGR